MLNKGWLLQSYDSDIETCKYVFERVTEEHQKNLVYKIDFREFDKKEEFEEYKEIFEDAGWKLLSKNKSYTKHIFYTDSKNAHYEIFSDQESYEAREKRRGRLNLQSKYLVMTVIGLALTTIGIVLTDYYEYGAGLIMGVALSLLFFACVKMLGNEERNQSKQ